jgi:hypothetical protein
MPPTQLLETGRGETGEENRTGDLRRLEET